MKSFIVFALFVAAAVAAPAYENEKEAVVTGQKSDVRPDGFESGYQTSNGISASEQGALKNLGQENEALEVRGQYQYTGIDGVVYSVTYIANEDGFQPQGSHIPRAV